jgi:hypothetical protein
MHILNTRTALSALALVLLLGCGGKSSDPVPSVLDVSPSPAPVGSNVVITGAGFTGVSVVSFSEAPAPWFRVDSGQQITATVPANAITGTVVVGNPAGLGDYTRDTGSFTTAGKSFTVTPAITGVDPTHGPAGTVVTVTGSGFFGVASVAIGTDATGSSTVTYNDPNHVTVIVGANATGGNLVLSLPGLQATWPGFAVP